MAVTGVGKVYFVPFGDFTSPSLERVAREYGRKLDTDVSVLPAISLPRRSGKQYLADDLIASLQRSYPQQSSDPASVLIAITNCDMNRQDQAWRYSYAKRAGRLAVISSARMDVSNFGADSDQDLLDARVRKILLRQLGILYFGIPQRDDPRSVFHGVLNGPGDLDRMSLDDLDTLSRQARQGEVRPIDQQ
ncbi:MAG: hypothetical protein WDZ37_01255 [Solirubrobacterales bacterium]